MSKRHFENWMDGIDDDDINLLGSRFARALERHDRRHVDREQQDREWYDKPRKRVRPEPHRERFS